MSKAVLMAIQPKYCELIASGKKTIEVRKTRPKFETPFKCYIYETKTKDHYAVFHENTIGKVIGEFVCDFIYEFDEESHEIRGPSFDSVCLTPKELFDYGNGKCLYGLKISNLIIYDTPKTLNEFTKTGALSYDDWLYALYNGNSESSYEKYLMPFKVTKPPQSWYYVE